MKFIISILTSLLLLVGCDHNSNQPLEGQPISENPFLPLSTTNDHADPTEEPLNVPGLDEETPDLNEAAPGTNDDTDEDRVEIAPELEDDQSVPPGFAIPEVVPEQQKEVEVVSDEFQLPFQDFKERWNALSSEQGSNLEITSFKKLENTVYQGQIGEGLELTISSVNNRVQRIQLLSKKRTNQDVLSMLTGWSQIVYMVEPEVDPHQIDELFHEFGVGPNLNLQDVKEKTVERNGVLYTVNQTDTVYLFEASYSKS